MFQLFLVPKTSSIAVWSSPGVPPCISRMDGGHRADLSQDYVFESIIPPAKDEPGRVNLCEPGGFDSAAASSLRSRLSPLLPSRPYFCGSLGRLRQHPAENLVVSCLRTSCSAGRHRRGLPCSARAGWATALPGSELDTKEVDSKTANRYTGRGRRSRVPRSAILLLLCRDSTAFRKCPRPMETEDSAGNSSVSRSSG